jgi:acyl carrier protein
MTDASVLQRVVTIVAKALNVPSDRVTPSASLVDDLGAESIDFLDILFQLETAFSIDIPADELWRGAIDSTNQDTIDASIKRLKVQQPEYRWDRLPARLAPSDLPRLITVQTIVRHLNKRGIS